MSWREVQLGDVIRLKRGHDLPASARVLGDVPIVSSSGITGFHNVAKVAGPGVVTGRYGTLGEVHYVEGDYWPLNTALYVEDFKGNHPRFVSYLLMTLELGSQNAAGAVPGVNRNTLHQMVVQVPDIETQHQISEVLKAYDDLIATNQRRIALLEDAARRLYREWFVHLRFPGHEQVEVKDGVPQGWRLLPIGQCFDFHIGGGWGKEVAESSSSEAAYVIRGTDLPRIRNGERGSVPLRFHPERNLASRRLEPGDIVFEVSGGSRDQGVGRLLHVTSQLLDQFDKPIMCASFCKLIRPKRGLSELLACALEHLRVTAALKSFENQSASNIVNFAFSEFCDKQLTLLPAEVVLAAFRSAIAPFWEQMTTLAEQQAKLAQARDLLLPKLMSGQIDVSGIALP